MSTREHWETAWSAKEPHQQSWFQNKPEHSLGMIHRSGVTSDSPVIDVGGGASHLVDHLLHEGYQDLTVLDISAIAIEKSRQRLGDAAGRVQWFQQDVLTFVPPQKYGLWHDRAVFHFLRGEQDQQLYLDVLCCALRRGGQLVVAAFALDGPEKCSGLEVCRHDAASLQHVLGNSFHLQEQENEVHLTPAGKPQRFGYYRFTYG